MFAALGIHSFPIANGEQLCHARNLSRVLCPQSKPPAEEDKFDIEDCLSSTPMGKYPTLRIRKKIVQISVKRDSDGSLGFTLCGGIIEDNPSLSRPLIVSHVRRGGPVEREGSIRAGDRLLAVDGHSVEHASLAEAQALLQHRRYCEHWKEDDLDSSQGNSDSCSGECFTLLVVEYDVVEREDLSKSPGPFLVELQLDYPDEELGLSLAMLPEEWPLSQKQRPAALVEAVRAASIAERCGALHSGDIILSIEKVPVGEAASKSDDESVVDDGLSTAQSLSWVVRIEVLPLSQVDRAISSRSIECEKSDRSKRVSQTPHEGGSSSSAESLIWNSHRSQRWPPSPPPPPPPPPPCRRTPTHIMGCANSEMPKVPCEEISNLEEFLQMTYIRDSNDSENMISWQRTSSMSLGAAADCPHGSDIQVESQDQINFARVKPLSWFGANEDNIEERCSSSHNGGLDSGDDGGDGDLNVSSSSCFQLTPYEGEGEPVIYVVKVYRNGGPLGITLSGTEDPSENIIISALVDGGPAKSTAALCVGDRLLAVGGESVAGKPLSEAVALLRAAADPVTLRIARSPELCPVGEHPLVGNGVSAVRNLSHACELDESYLTRVSNSISEVVNKDNDTTNGHSIRVPCSCPSTNCRHPHLKQVTSGNNSSCAVLRGSLPYELDPCSASLNHSSPSSVGSGRGPPPPPLPSETLRITLFKDGIYEDFGFSVSDGLYERGVYVNRIRKGGPADVGSLQPYDRIIQVNDTITYAFDCCLTVPLIASAGDKIDLTVMRYPHFVPKGLSY